MGKLVSINIKQNNWLISFWFRLMMCIKLLVKMIHNEELFTCMLVWLENRTILLLQSNNGPSTAQIFSNFLNDEELIIRLSPIHYKILFPLTKITTQWARFPSNWVYPVTKIELVVLIPASPFSTIIYPEYSKWSILWI